ncbi:MAG: site-specific integrase [Deltaproteobacteria bacterium]|nr:site-specific integrase [Deltaproteobacteria bacterium]
MTATKWVTRWRFRISAKPVMPGVWKREDGGFLVRGKVTDQRTGKQHQILKALDVAKALDARAWLEAEQQRLREGTLVRTLPTFSVYAISLAERKARDGRMKSAASRMNFASDLERHLLPVFGLLRVDEIRRADIVAWRSDMGNLIAKGTYKPSTVNGWFGHLRSTINAAVHEFELERNPIAGFERFDTSEHPTYTHEEPNALDPTEGPAFLAKFRALYPDRFAMAVLGFATGLRPSSLRPLRRSGPNADVLWDDGVLLVRRSHTRRQEVMNTTKTSRRQRIALPAELMAILRHHAEALPAGPQRESELLFPNPTGSFWGPNALSEPFAKVRAALGITKRLTPRAMRRTFQDFARTAEIRDVITRSISGHATSQMQEHYSTPAEVEQRAGLARVIDLAGVREAAATPTAPRGVKRGVKGGGVSEERTVNAASGE